MDPTLIVGLVVFLALVAVGGALIHLAGRANHQAESLAPLARLASIEALLRQLAERGGELELRRLEHVLIDIRDGQKRLEERLTRLLEERGGRDAAGPVGVPVTSEQSSLSERVTTRLIAMGFERIEIVTPLEDLEVAAGAAESEVVVEARRGGAMHKGRVLLQDGAISDVRLRSSYEAYP